MQKLSLNKLILRNNTNEDALKKSKHFKACSHNFWKNQNLKLAQRLKTVNRLSILLKLANSQLLNKPMLEMWFNQHLELRTLASRSGLRTCLPINSIHSNFWKSKVLKQMVQPLSLSTLKRRKKLGTKSRKCINWCILMRKTMWESLVESSEFKSRLFKK